MMNFSQNELSFLAVSLISALTFAVVVRFVFQFAQKHLQNFAQRTPVLWDNWLVQIFSQTGSWFVFSWVFFPLLWTQDLTDKIWPIVQRLSQIGQPLLVFVTSAQVVLWGFYGLKLWKQEGWAHKNRSSTAAFNLLYTALQLVLLTLVALVALSHLGVNVGALIAGVGIGGAAIALAAQNILGDFLSSLSIVMDKPFETGDYIVVGADQGEVEDIGIKTTRVRSLGGEQIIFTNKDLLESRIHNYERMNRRRVIHHMAFSPLTSPQQIKQLAKQIELIFHGQSAISFDRCHLCSIEATHLLVEVVFWVESPSHHLYMDLQQDVLLKILKILSQEKIQVARALGYLEIEDSRNFSTLSEAKFPQSSKPMDFSPPSNGS